MVAADRVPPRLRAIVAWVEEWTVRGARLIEVGAGNGVLAAVLTRDGRPTLAIDLVARNVVACEYAVLDATSDAFFDLVAAEGPAAVVCRRSLAPIATAGWAARLRSTGVPLLLSQACEKSESVAFPGPRSKRATSGPRDGAPSRSPRRCSRRGVPSCRDRRRPTR